MNSNNIFNTTNLGNIAKVQTGPFGSQLHEKDYVEKGVPIITVEHLGHGRIIKNDIPCVSESDVLRLKKFLLKTGDIVFSRVGSVDRSVLIRQEEDGWMFSGRCLRVRVTTKDVLPAYLCYYFTQNSFRQYVRNNAVGATMPSLNSSILRRLKIIYPLLSKQKQINGILSTIDDTLANNYSRIQLLEEAVRLLFREWFVYFRFPGHEEVKIVDGVPQGWEKSQVKDIIRTVNSRKKIQKSEYDEAGLYPCVDQSQEYISGYTDRKDYVINNTVPIVIFGDHTRIIKYVDFPFVSGADGTQLLVSKHIKITAEFLYFILKNINLSNYFYARHFKFLKDQWILVPSEDLCSSFNLFSKDIMKQIGVLKSQNQKLVQARDLLLPRLMSGAIDPVRYDKLSNGVEA